MIVLVILWYPSVSTTSSILLCLLVVSVVYNEWSLWNWCSAPCGITGVRNRTRGCHSTLFGLVNFNGKCDTGGEEKESCVGACPHTTIAATLYPGIHGYIYTYLGIVMKFIMSTKRMLPRRLSACTKVPISWIYDTRVLYDAHFFLQRSLIYTAKLKGVKRNM